MRVLGLLTLTLWLAAAPAFAQRIEPPHWWAGFQDRRLQLMVEADGIAASRPAESGDSPTTPSASAGSRPAYRSLQVRQASGSKARDERLR